jgi:hypothetical protein
MTRKSIAVVAQWTARLTGATQLVLGIAIWTGLAVSLILLHISIGLLLLASLWALTGLGLGRVAGWRLALAAAWGLLMVMLGLSQANLLVGPAHWLVQVLHLVVGLAAVAQAETLARGIRGWTRATS